ncbi:MAG: M56 family metallopeptidase [Acidobacteriaceae bacterium]
MAADTVCHLALRIVFLAIRFGLAWAKMNAVKRRARPFALEADVPVLSSSEPIEPGIFGILRPVLLLPDGIPEQLSAEQMRAIVAHEMCHVRRRDNLTFAIHMVVETLFWFHPMVWGIGSRLIEEREHACDEAVIQAGSKAQVYAEGILNVCKFYVETPLNCISGVTGADPKKRTARIMTERVARRLSLGRMLLLGAAVVLALAMPVLLGITRAEAQANGAATVNKDLKFEVGSIRQNKSGGQQIVGKTTPDSFEMRNMFLGAAILTAYVPRAGGALYYSDEQVIGIPHWLESDQDRYDINAKVDQADLTEWQNATKQPAMLRAMLQNMLADRLKLKVHRSTKEEPVYALVVGKKGPHFKESVPGESHPNAYPIPGGGLLSMETKDGWITTHYFDISIDQVISMLLPSPGRPIQDRTGLTGNYDISITKPVPASAGTPEVKPVETSAAEIANQLGLKLERSVGKVETLVIDRVERPSPN